MNWLTWHGRAAIQALWRMAKTPLNTLFAVLGIGIALALPAGGAWLLTQFAVLSKGTATSNQLTLFLPVSTDRKASLAVEARIKALPGIAQTQLLPREDTLARMKGIGGLADTLSVLAQNPFPDAIVVTPMEEDPTAIESLAATLRQWREIEHVQVDTDWAHRLAALARFARTALVLLASMMGLGLLAIVFNTVRSQATARRAESELARLLGATPAFIRRPLLWQGVWLGLAGGLVAWSIVIALLLALRAPLADLAGLYGLELTLAPPALTEGALLLLFASGLGWLGARLSILRHLESRS